MSDGQQDGAKSRLSTDRARMRQLLDRVLRTDDDFNAFCADYFEDTYRSFSGGMTRDAKTTALLTREDASAIHAKLREQYPEQVPQSAEPGGAALPGSLAGVPRAALPMAILEQVLALATRAPWPRRALIDAYHCGAPPGRRDEFDSYQGEDLVKRMLLRLHTALKQSDSTHPLLTLVWHLVQIASEPNSPQELVDLTALLTDWFDKAASSLGITSAVEHLKNQVDADRLRLRDLELYLLISLKRSSKARNQYVFSAWRVLTHDRSKTWFIEDIQPIELPGRADREVGQAALPTLVKELVDQLAEELDSAKNRLTVELLVPYELLGCDADQWKLGLGSDLIGSDYKVVIRSWDRSYDKNCKERFPKWKEKWDRLHADPKPAVRFLGREHVSEDGALLRVPAKAPPCAPLDFVPAVDGKNGIAPVLRDVIDKGIPIAIWPRKTCEDAAKLREFLSELTSKKSLREWREEVRTFRQEALDATKPDDHPGSHLALLWDNPHKLPPDALGKARLRTPEKTDTTS